MKTRNVFAITLIGFLILSGISLQIPNAQAAFTWTNNEDFLLAASADYHGDIWRPDSSNFVVIYSDDASDDLSARRCTTDQDIDLCAVTLIASTNAQGANFDFAEIEEVPNLGIICYVDETNGDLDFARSTTGGQFWTAGITIDDTNAFSQTAGCGIDAVDSTNYYAVYHDTTAAPDVFYFAESHNSGASWAFSTIETQGAASNQFVDLLVLSDTDFVAIKDDGGSIRSCLTDDTGATWTCFSGAVPMDQGLGDGDFEYDPIADKIVGAVQSTGTTIAFTFSDDGGATWITPVGVLTGVANTLACCEIILGPDIDSYFIAFCQYVAGSIGNYIASSFDGGSNWDVEYAQPTQTGAYDAVNGCRGAWGTLGADGSAYILTTGNAGGNQIFIASHTTVFGGPTTADATTDSFGTETLVGFDIDVIGQTLVARLLTTTPDNTVYTWDAISLATPLSSFPQPNCNRVDGVMAVRTQVAFVDCETPSGQVNFLRIRDKADLTTLTPPQGCDPGACEDNIPIDSSASIFTFGIDIGNVETYPISYDDFFTRFVGLPSCGNCDYAFVSWTFGTTTGRIGVIGYVGQEGQNDVHNERSRIYASQNPDEICSFKRTQDERIYLAAVSQQQPTQLFRIDYSEDRDPGIFDANADLIPTIVGPIWSNSAYSQASAIACAEERIIVVAGTATPQTLFIVNTASGTPVVFPTGLSVSPGESRSVTISGDSKFYAYLDNGLIKIANTTNGNVTGTITQPTGTWVGMEMSYAAQNLWVATSTQVERYSIFSSTTIQPVSDLITDPAETTSTPIPGTDGLGVSNAASALDEIFGEGNGIIVVGVLFIFALAAVGFWAFGIVGVILGALLGLGVAIVEWFPAKVTFFLGLAIFGILIGFMRR